MVGETFSWQQARLNILGYALLTDPTYSQSSEARLYTFSQETKNHLRKFRLGTSRASDPQAVICTYVSPKSHTRCQPVIIQ